MFKQMIQWYMKHADMTSALSDASSSSDEGNNLLFVSTIHL